MKMKLGMVETHLRTVMRMMNRKLPIRLSYALSKNFHALKEEFEMIEEQRRKLCEQHAKRDEKGELIVSDGHFQFEEKELEDFKKEFNSLLEKEEEIAVYTTGEKVLEECMDDRYDPVTPGEIIELSFML